MTPEIQVADDHHDLVRSFLFLLKAYELGAEEKDRSVAIWDVGREIGLNEVDAEVVASDLQEMNLLYYSSLAGDVALTSFGVSEVVLARSQPHQPTSHFPQLSSMSDQMMLPLSNKRPPGVENLVDQLESFSTELSAENEPVLDLSPSIEELDLQLQQISEGSQSLLLDLEEIQLELQ